MQWAPLHAGSVSSAQKLDAVTEEEEFQRFYLQYFFPPSSVGEVRCCQSCVAGCSGVGVFITSCYVLSVSSLAPALHECSCGAAQTSCLSLYDRINVSQHAAVCRRGAWAAPAGGRWATATWRSGRSRPRCPRRRTGPTRCAPEFRAHGEGAISNPAVLDAL